MNNAQISVGEQIKKIRRSRLLTQEILAERVGIDYKSLGRIEKGDYYPALDTLMRLSTALDVPLREFFPSSEQNFENPLVPEMRHALVDFVYLASETDLLTLYKSYIKLRKKYPE